MLGIRLVQSSAMAQRLIPKTLCFTSLNSSKSVMIWPVATRLWDWRPFAKISCDFSPDKSSHSHYKSIDMMKYHEPSALEPNNLRKVESWAAFWHLIKPDLLLLLAVSITAIATAFVNIRTPRVIGKLVNVLNAALRSGSGVSWSQALFDIRQPALSLLALFAGQG